MNHTVNKARVVTYIASNFTAGLTDLVLTVRQPDGTPLTPAVTGQGAGVYTATYTPTQVGVHQEMITSATNGDKVFKAVDVDAFDESDVKADVDSANTAIATVKTDVDAVSTKVDTVKTDVDAVSTKVDTVKTDVDSVATAVAAVQTTANQILASEGKAGGYFA